LTVGEAADLLKNMLSTLTTQAAVIVSTVSLSWRKVATGAAAVGALGLGFHVMFGQNGLTAYEQKRQETKGLSLQLRSLEQENELLKGHVNRLQNDPAAIVHQAREELHYTRPGEVIYTLPAAPAGAKLITTQH
jgi:cell division protein FtsB